MTELYTIERIQRPVVKADKVFYSIDNLIKYLEEEYCPAEEKKIDQRALGHDSLRDFIINQLKSDKQTFYKRMSLKPEMDEMDDIDNIMEDGIIVRVMVMFDNYKDDKHVGISLEQFFVNRESCIETYNNNNNRG